MELNHSSIYNQAVLKHSKKMSYYGDSDLSNIHLLKLIYKHAKYACSYSCLSRMDQMVANLELTDPNICLEVLDGSFYPENSIGDVTSNPDVNRNQPPTISNSNLNVSGNSHTFSNALFINGFIDPNGDSYGPVVIKSLPANGSLEYDNVAVNVNQMIENPSLLRYNRGSTIGYSTSFNYTVFDDNPGNPMQSNVATLNITVDETSNSPSEIGDAAYYVDNRAVTVFNINHFTSSLDPAYSDPDGDQIDAIRVDEISTANNGSYFFYGTEVVVGQIISKTDIDGGNFIHVGSDSDDISTDSINFSARDSGSLIWVQ